jgi:hypothetical protein
LLLPVNCTSRSNLALFFSLSAAQAAAAAAML